VSLFDRFRRKRRTGPSPGQEASGKTLKELGEFMRSRPGVEAYAEPPTSVYAMSLCLVAADGEYLRRPVKDEKQAKELCGENGVPLYDARLVGYPRRMREYQRGTPQAGISLDDLPPLETTGRTEADPEPEHNPDRDD
jgi:hypothetical protein